MCTRRPVDAVSLLVVLLASLLLPACAEAPPRDAPTVDVSELNEEFRNPDVDTWVERFEREGREVWDHRDRIVRECALESGMDVADIGAGTGFFARLFARIVAPAGKVYAVDIARNFVDHVEATAKEEGLENVTGIVCTDESTGLEPSSIDLAFLSDTYHHLEKPASTLASIHAALRDGGQMVVIDMKRVEGESSEWVMNHVRASKEVFVQEIESAGFRLVREPEPLDRNYILVFEKSSP